MHDVAQRPSERRSLEVDFFRLNGFESYYKFTRDKNDEKGVTYGAVAWGDVSRLRHSFPSPDYFSARFARRFVFFAHANFFLLFPPTQSLVPD